MLDFSEINRVVKETASAALANVDVARIISEPTVDSEGREALHVTVVLNESGVDQISGDSVIKVLLEVGRNLRKAGEERPQIIDFATEEELNSGADTES